MPDNNNDDTSWFRRGLDNLGDLADAAADAVQASIDVARSGENPLNAANIANAQNRRRELTDLDRNVDDRIAREWEGQSEAEVGTASGLQRERFTARSIARDKARLYDNLVELRVKTAQSLLSGAGSASSPLWFRATINNTILPRDGLGPGQSWPNPIEGGIGVSANVEDVDPLATREPGSGLSARDVVNSSPVDSSWVDQIIKVAQNSLVYRQIIGPNGSPALEEEFNNAGSGQVVEGDITVYSGGVENQAEGLRQAYEAAGSLLRQIPRSELEQFITTQINQKLAEEQFGSSLTSGYGLLQDIAQDVTNFFGATASTDYAAAQESDLLNALRLNYVWLFYAYPLIKSLAIDAELLVPGGPGLAASGGEPSTSYYEDLVFNQRIGTSTETADMLFGNQFGSTVFSGFQEYIEAFCALIYRIKIHNAILAYEQRLRQQVLHGDVTDVVNGEEYAGNVDDAERLQIFKDILRTQEGQSITSEENARLKRLAEQCFLTDFIEEFSKLNQERAENYLTFTPVQGRTDTLVNKLIFDPALACMDKLTPAELSSLVPKIRLYKVLFDVADDQEGGLLQTYEQLVPFENYVGEKEVTAMMSPGVERGQGAGIVSFDWTLDGTNPFTDRRAVFGQLKLFFQSMSTFIQTISLPVEGPEDIRKPFRYVDLVNINMTTGNSRIGWNPDYFKLRIEVGWEDPRLEVFTGDIECKKKAIQASQMIMYVTANEHNFEINDQGNVELTIEYIGWLEASYDDGDSDVLATEETIRNRLQRRELITQVINEDPCNTEKIGELENQFRAQIDRENYSAWQRLLVSMDEQERIFYIPVPSDQLENYYDAQRQGASIRGLWNQVVGASDVQDIDFSLRSTDEQSINRAISTVETNVDESILSNISRLTWDQAGDYVNVQYFFLGDLVEVALQLVSTSYRVQAAGGMSPSVVGKQEKRLRMLLGPLTIRQINQNGQEEFLYNVNLADVPVSVHYFIEWFLKDVIGQNRRSYSVFQFVQNLVNTMVRPLIIDQCKELRNIPRQSLSFRTNVLSGAGLASDSPQGAMTLDPIELYKNSHRGTRLNVDRAFDEHVLAEDSDLNGALIQKSLPGSSPYHYMLIYMINSPQLSPGRGSFMPIESSGDDEGDPGDRVRGIYHLGIGKNSGILKKLAFSKTDFPLREARIERELLSQATGLAVLANVYSIKATLFGNTMFFPGSRLYIDPTGIDPKLGSPSAAQSPARLLGIGGYHTVYNVKSYIEAGRYETVIDALFESPGGTGVLEDVPEEGGAGRCTDGPRTRSVAREE